MSRRAAALVLAFGAFGVPLAVLPLGAEGQKPAPRAAAADAGDRYDPETKTAISQHMETLVKGNERFVAKDVNGAIDLYKKAIQLNPKHPLGPYLLGEAYLAQENLSEAEAAFKQAAELSDSRNQVVRSHVLFALADCYEREKKREQARAAWQAYAEHAPKVPDGGAFPGSAAARIKAIDDWMKLDKAYEIVRQRIADEKKDAGSAASKK